MNLTNDNIANTISEVQKFFQNAQVSKRDLMKISLVLEEALILYQEKFGDSQIYEVRMKKWFSAPKVVIRVEAAPFNPLGDNGESIFPAAIMNNLLSYETAGTSYRYENGFNEVAVFSNKKPKFMKIIGGKTSIALILAIISAYVVNFLPQDVQHFLIYDLSAPLLHSLMGLIAAVTGPLIFISVLSGICVMDNVTTFSTIGLKILRRFVILTLLITIVSATVDEIFFPVIKISGNSASVTEEVISMLLAIIPTNFITPFIESNILQIVIIAILTGVCILTIGERVNHVKTFVVELNQIIFRMMDTVSKVIYLTIFLSIFNAISINSLSQILSTWKIVVANILSITIFCGVHLAYLAFVVKINIADFLHKLSTVLTVSFTTASGSITIPENINVGKNKFNIDSKLCDLWVPLSHSMFSPSVTSTLVVCVFYSAFAAGQSLSINQLLILAFLLLQLSIATPKIPGGILAVFTILLGQLNLPLDAVGSLMIGNVFWVNIVTCLGMVVRNTEFVDLAHSLSKK